MAILDKEDYQEPRCLLDMGQRFGAGERPPLIDMTRVTEKLDEYCNRRDFAGAERHLDYWLAEARQTGDRRAEFLIQNERMGFYRKQDRQDEAISCAMAALGLLDAVGEQSSAAGTGYVNVGTVYENFAMHSEAIPYFEKAREIYERELPPGDSRLAGLYNNMALALAATGRFDEARALFERALEIMEGKPNGPWEQAVTWLNLADAAEAELGYEAAEERIQLCLERAERLLAGSESERDGYYAFVCEKCAPGFDHYGWFACARELRERAERIYAGT